MKSLNRKITIWSASILAVILIVIGVWILTAKDVRGDFVNTGEKIQNQIQQISLLTSQSLYQFQAISEKQKEGRLKEALDLVVEEKNRNKEINSLAMGLTEELKVLAKISLDLNDKENRRIAEEAIQYQIEAISHLINYGSGVDILLEEMARKYEAQIEGRYLEVKRDIGQLIELIKKEIEVAEGKSKQFVQTLDKFYLN